MENQVNTNNKLRVIYWSRKIDQKMLVEAFKNYNVKDFSFVNKKHLFDVRVALLEFNDKYSAEKAKKEMNCTEVNGELINIKWASNEQKAHWNPEGAGNLFVKNFSDTRSLFSAVSELEVKINYCKESKRIPGNFYLEVGSEEDAKKCIDNLNGKVVDNKVVKVEKYIPINERRSKQKQQEGASFTNLYVTNLPLSTTEKVVRETFQNVGKVGSILLKNDSQMVNKFAYVNMSNHEEASKCLLPPKEGLQGISLTKDTVDQKTNKIKIEQYMSKSVRKFQKTKMFSQTVNTSIKNLYVKDVPSNWTDDEFRKYFTEFGKVSSAKIARNEKGESKRYGFVSFTTTQAAIDASKKKHDNKMKVYKFMSKRERQLRLAKVFKNDYDPDFQDKNQSLRQYKLTRTCAHNITMHPDLPDQPKNQAQNVVNGPQIHQMNNYDQPQMPHPQPAQQQNVVTHGQQQNNLNHQQHFIPNFQHQNAVYYHLQAQPQNVCNQPPLSHPQWFVPPQNGFNCPPQVHQQVDFSVPPPVIYQQADVQFAQPQYVVNNQQV